MSFDWICCFEKCTHTSLRLDSPQKLKNGWMRYFNFEFVICYISTHRAIVTASMLLHGCFWPVLSLFITLSKYEPLWSQLVEDADDKTVDEEFKRKNDEVHSWRTLRLLKSTDISKLLPLCASRPKSPLACIAYCSRSSALPKLQIEISVMNAKNLSFLL